MWRMPFGQCMTERETTDADGKCAVDWVEGNNSKSSLLLRRDQQDSRTLLSRRDVQRPKALKYVLELPISFQFQLTNSNWSYFFREESIWSSYETQHVGNQRVNLLHKLGSSIQSPKDQQNMTMLRAWDRIREDMVADIHHQPFNISGMRFDPSTCQFRSLKMAHGVIMYSSLQCHRFGLLRKKQDVKEM